MQQLKKDQATPSRNNIKKMVPKDQFYQQFDKPVLRRNYRELT